VTAPAPASTSAIASASAPAGTDTETEAETAAPGVALAAAVLAGAAPAEDVVERDVLIVGAGPVGLYAAYYAGFRGLSAAVADSLPEVGGQIAAMYPEKPIYDVAGFPEVRGRDLVAGLAA
jgi:NADPH-dependent 2,4-dienoyl-CoA reductase/sulfur reductase-like enzyme